MSTAAARANPVGMQSMSFPRWYSFSKNSSKGIPAEENKYAAIAFFCALHSTYGLLKNI